MAAFTSLLFANLSNGNEPDILPRQPGLEDEDLPYAHPPGFQQNGGHSKANRLIGVIDYTGVLRKEVRRLFEPQRSRVELFTSDKAFLNRDVHNGPCCLVMDADAARDAALQLLGTLAHFHRTEQVVLFAQNTDAATCARAFRAGAVDFLTPSFSRRELLAAVEKGLRRSEILFQRRNEREKARRLLQQLTPREREVLGFVIAGKLNKVIGAELGITEKTIKKHRGRIMEKLRFRSVAELVNFALRCGLEPACPMGPKSPIRF